MFIKKENSKYVRKVQTLILLSIAALLASDQYTA
jgi:hypothetical protein